MFSRIFEVFQFNIVNLKFWFFRHVLEKYNPSIYMQDESGFFVKRESCDNFRFIFENNCSCDAGPMMSALKEVINDNDIAFDIGANIGITSMWMSKKSKQVYAFEPEAKNLSRFKHNIHINGIENVRIIEKAVTFESVTVCLNLYESYGHHSLSTSHLSTPKGKVLVDAVSLSDFCRAENINKIDLIKIDVEGFEYEVLLGAEELLATNSIKFIVFEHSPALLRKQGRDMSQVIDLLFKYGYTIYRLNHEQINKVDVARLGQEDLYAVARSH